MDIFKGLFRNFFRSNQPGRNYEDKTPYKIQVMRKALTGMNVECAGKVFVLKMLLLNLIVKRMQNLKIINIKELWQVYMKYLMIFFAYLMM